MMRSWIKNHYPHLLLAASSAAWLAIVLFSADHGHRPGYA